MGVPKSWCVYKHTNIENKKVYIGITSQKATRRWNGGRGYVGNKDFINLTKEGDCYRSA